MGRIKAKTHLEKLGFSETDKKNSKHDIIQNWTCENIQKILSETIMKDNPNPFKVLGAKWEHQIMHINGNYRMIVGFIDLFVGIKGKFYFKNSKEYVECTKDILIEVKTQIPSCGELIRQMRAYQSYENFERRHLTEYLIIANDDRHEKTLNEQGFWFYKYKDPTQLF